VKIMPASDQFAPPRGNPPSIEWRALTELAIDEAYQRDANRRAVLAIAKAWDWRLCAPLTVARRGDPASFFVIDGQHRLEAARLRGDIAHLPCLVSAFESVAEEAGMFVEINTRRQKVSPLETFRAELAAGDAKAQQVARIVANAGLHIARHSNPNSWKPGHISAIQGIKGAMFRHGETVAAAALQDIAVAFPEEIQRFSGRILAALFEIRAKPPKGFDEGHLRRALASKRQGLWNAAMLKRQARYGETQQSAMEYAILDACAFSPIKS
jgi:hypothetical protein